VEKDSYLKITFLKSQSLTYFSLRKNSK